MRRIIESVCQSKLSSIVLKGKEGPALCAIRHLCTKISIKKKKYLENSLFSSLLATSCTKTKLTGFNDLLDLKPICRTLSGPDVHGHVTSSRAVKMMGYGCYSTRS